MSKKDDGQKLTKWVKPNKKEVEINDHPANIAKAEELGWKRKGVKLTAAEKKAAKDAEVEAELQAQIAAEEAEE